MTSSRKRFNSSQDWNIFTAGRTEFDGAELYQFRKNCYQDIEDLRGRPLLVYATRFVDNNLPHGTPNSIEISDVDGFTDLVNSVPNDIKEIDVLLHSPGGSPDATERIVNILRNRFSEVHFLVPHSAYSAATMLALSGNSVTLHSSATLGPIDPQLNGTPARSIRRGFENVKEQIKREGPEALPAYIPLIEKYTIHLLEICDDSEKLSKELVSQWIKNYMLGGKERSKGQISKAVKFFSNYDKHLLHSRPLVINKIKQFDLNIHQADEKLADLIWEAYILINGFFAVSTFAKLFENKYGVSWGRHIKVEHK